MARRLFSATENSPLRSDRPVENETWDRLMRSAARLPGDFVRRTVSGVTAGPYVGVVDFGWCQLEVFPKASADLTDRQRRAFLLDLLQHSGLVPGSLVSEALVGTARVGLLELLIASFAERLHDELLLGVPRRYHPVEECLPQVKGRIRFSELARKLPSEQHEIPVRYAPLRRDNGLTQILRALSATLTSQAQSPDTLQTLEHCDRMLGAAERIPLARTRPRRIRLRREESRWSPFVELAALLQAGQAPIPVTRGGFPGFGLFFTLHDVFERLLRRVLAPMHEAGLQLRQRPNRPHLLHPVSGGAPSLALRPDLVFEDDAATVSLVADAKWKELDLRSPSLGLVPADVYQVTSYMAAHGADRGLLFFPELPSMADEMYDEVWRRRFSLVGGQGVLTVGSVDVIGLAATSRARRADATEKVKRLVSLAAAGTDP